MKYQQTGFLHFRRDGHCLQDCITLQDDDGMGFAMDKFAAFEGKDVRLTVELMEERRTGVHAYIQEECGVLDCYCHAVVAARARGERRKS